MKLRDSTYVVVYCNLDRADSVTDVAARSILACRDYFRYMVILECGQSLSFLRVLAYPLQSFHHFIQRDNTSGFIYIYPLLLPFSSKIETLNKLSIAVTCFLLRFFLFLKFPNQKKLIWIWHPHLSFILSFFPRSYEVLYDMVDYFTFRNSKKAQMLESQKIRILQRADYIFSISTVLKKLYEKYTRKPIHIVPQGFSKPISLIAKTSNKIISNGKPVIGYVGRISERLDVNILFTLCTHNPQWQFVFIGPIEHEIHVRRKPNFMKDIEALFSLPNVLYVGKKTRLEVYSYLRLFLICIIPYDTHDLFNKYCFPMKVFEYFYMGKPVVSSKIFELERFKKFVYVATSLTEWERHIHYLLRTPWPHVYQKEQKRLAIVNTWENKIRSIYIQLYRGKNTTYPAHLVGKDQ